MYSFLLMLFIGFLIRILFIGNPGFVADIAFWKSWSLAAIDHGIVWTSLNTNMNYPPGFIYVLWIMGKLYSLFGDPHNFNVFWRENNFGFLVASKSIAIFSDIVVAWLIYWWTNKLEALKASGEVRNEKWDVGYRNGNHLDVSKSKYPASHFTISHLTSHISLPFFLASVFYLNPVVILDSALWGQVESFGILFTLVAIILLFHKRPYIASAIFVVGCLMKLQNIIFIPLFFLFIFRYFDIKTTIKSVASATAAFFLVNLPFVIANKMDQVLYLLTVNSDYFPWLSLNAHNPWWIVAGTHGMDIIDKITVLGILNAKTVGLLAFASMYLLCCLLVFFKPSPRNFLLSLTVAIFAFFLFTTQSHERYSYPVLVLLLFFYPFLEEKSLLMSKWEVGNEKLDTDARNGKSLKSKNQNISLHYLTSHISHLTSLKYFWILYFLLTLTIFFNIHWGLIANYPQYGSQFLSSISTPPMTILNSYLLTLLFFLLLPYVFSQISYWSFVLCSLLFVCALMTLNASYIFTGNVSLTSFKPIIQKQDYGSLQTNKSVNSFQGWKKWTRLSNNYFYYRKGFGTHANSNLVFDINRKFRTFETDIGVDTEADVTASVVFQVWGDGQMLYESQKLGRWDFPQHVNVNVSNVAHLGLVATDAGDGINNDHADWLNPVLYK